MFRSYLFNVAAIWRAHFSPSIAAEMMTLRNIGGKEQIKYLYSPKTFSMKTKITLLLLFIVFTANAKFMDASILFNDGHTEKGFVKSFLEDKFIDLSFSNKLESNLNMNDHNLKFKTEENGTIRTINIDEVNEITLTYKNGGTEIFKVLYLKSIDSGGNFVNTKYKMWFPVVKKGKINVYGYKYTEVSGNGEMSGSIYSTEFIYYFQHSDENYAINPFENLTMLSVMNGNYKKIFKTFLTDLFKHCPEYAAKALEEQTKEQTKESRKNFDKNRNDKIKEFKGQKISRASYVYETDYWQFSKMIADYEKDCPN